MSLPLTDLFEDIMLFQKTKFPYSDSIAKLNHLSKEVEELIDELEKVEVDQEAAEMEFADCLILLLGAAGHWGFTPSSLIKIAEKKMEINWNRKWGQPDENGVCAHIKE